MSATQKRAVKGLKIVPIGPNQIAQAVDPVMKHVESLTSRSASPENLLAAGFGPDGFTCEGTLQLHQVLDWC